MKSQIKAQSHGNAFTVFPVSHICFEAAATANAFHGSLHELTAVPALQRRNGMCVDPHHTEESCDVDILAHCLPHTSYY